MMSSPLAKQRTCVAVVHDNLEFLVRTVNALRADGHDTAAFLDTMSALNALAAALPCRVLVTRVHFPPGQPHGVSLALMIRNSHPDIKILFAEEEEETQIYTKGLGEFLPSPVAADQIVVTVGRML